MMCTSSNAHVAVRPVPVQVNNLAEARKADPSMRHLVPLAQLNSGRELQHVQNVYRNTKLFCNSIHACMRISSLTPVLQTC